MGTEHEGAAAVAFLDLLVGNSRLDQLRDDSGNEREPVTAVQDLLALLREGTSTRESGRSAIELTGAGDGQ